MKVKIITHKKDDGVVFIVMPSGSVFDIGIEDYDLTERGLNTLKKYFGEESLAIAETLKTMMIDMDSIDRKTVEETFFPFEMVETDPNGIDQHALGAKLDSGKVKAGLLVDFSNALLAVAEVGTFGANKYTRGGWLHVDNGIERYTDAMFRHFLKEPTEPNDPDSELKHAAHAAWNALARIELMLVASEETAK